MNRWRRAYHRLPLPPAMKNLLSAIRHRLILRGIRKLRRALTLAQPFASPSIAPGEQLDELPDYIVWGAIDWNFRHQRPQQLAQGLSSTGRRVIYVDATLTDLPGAGFTLHSLDADGRLFRVSLFANGAPVIYSGAPDAALVRQLCGGIGEVLIWARSRRVISLVQHPFWYEVARELPNSRLVYDCIDHHQGFADNTADSLQLEQRLVDEADLRLFTSAWLARKWAPQGDKPSAIIRNAADFASFSRRPESVYRDPLQRRVIGYFGAIANWFDHELVACIAQAFPQHAILLIGADTVGAAGHLRKYSNVEFVGEVSYSGLPYYLHGFDLCMLPFRIIELTLATNPVKVYEYLAAGKPVVSVELPEMHQFGPLVHLARNNEEFVAAIGQSLAAPAHEQKAQRQAFAARQTWMHRVNALTALAEAPERDALTSIVMVTYNNLALTRACLDSIEAHADGEKLELILVDNASRDGTAEFLTEWAASRGHKVILNETNRGFAAANNQGLQIARGDYLVLLNNDTQVTSGWLATLRRHLRRNPRLGLIGPVTNNIGNQARVDIRSASLADMHQAARRYTCQHLGESFLLPTLAFFCVMMSRSTYLRVGALDEVYGLGFFEDDDYCRRVEEAGLFSACARDVFIHHHLSASFGQMNVIERQALFEKNKAIYEARWGTWPLHSHE